MLVGGRGTGKSTVIESLRYALGLEPLTEEISRLSRGIIQQVVKPGSRIWVVVRSVTPEVKDYLIERVVPNPPVVRDEEGLLLDLAPSDLVPGIEIYGQQELAEISKNPQKVLEILKKFLPKEIEDLSKLKKELKRKLEESRRNIIGALKEKEDLEAELSRLPLVEEKIKQLRDAETESLIYEQRMVLREKGILNEIREHLYSLSEVFEYVAQKLEFNLRSFLPTEPHPAEGLKYLETAISLSERTIKRWCYFLYEMDTELQRSIEEFKNLLTDWRKTREIPVEEKLRKREKELAIKLDSREITRWYREYESLKPKKNRLELIKKKAQYTLYRKKEFTLRMGKYYSGRMSALQKGLQTH